MAETVPATSKWIPFYRRRWFVILCLLTISPIAWLPLFTGKIYRKASGEGNWVPVKTSSRAIYIVLSFWLTAFIFFHYMPVSPDTAPTAVSQDTNPPEKATTTVAQNTNPPAATDTSSPTPAASDNDAELGTDDLRAEIKDIQDLAIPGSIAVEITDTGDSDITINRVVINNRAGVPGCDFNSQMNAQNLTYLQHTYGHDTDLYGADLSTGQTLKTGDHISFAMTNQSCGTIVKADVETNKGHGTYNFGAN